jgi:hypothetical protein
MIEWQRKGKRMNATEEKEQRHKDKIQEKRTLPPEDRPLNCPRELG